MKIYRKAIDRATVKEVLENYQGKVFNDIFGDNDRIVFPLKPTKIMEIERKLREGETRTRKKYTLDIGKQIAYRENDSRPMKIGKVIASELSPKETDEWSRYVNGVKGDFSIILSRNPIDIVRMSDHSGIYSCHSPNGGFFECAKEEATSGGAIAYVVKTSDLESFIQNETTNDDPDPLNQQEIFTDQDRKIYGLEPLSRVRINRYTNEEDELAIPIDRTYGNYISEFYNNVKNFLLEKQKDGIIAKVDDFSNFSRNGGSYADLNDPELFKSFFGDKKGVYKNLESKSGNKMREQYEAEVQNVLDKYDELEHCELYADINDDDGVYVYFGASFTFRYFMPGIQNTYEYEIEREDQKLIQKIMDINLDFDPEFKMTRRTTAIELEVRFFGTGNPDDFDSFAYDVYNVDSYKYPEVYNKIFTIILGYEDMPLADNLNTLKIFDQEYGEIEDIEINIAAPSTGNPSDQPNKEDIKNIINDSMKRRMTSIVSNQTFFDFYEDDMDTLRTHIIVNNLDFHLYGPHTMKGGAFVSNQPSGLIQYQLSIPREEVLRLGIQYFRLMESVWDAIQNEVFMQLQAEMKLKQVPLKSVPINNTNVQPVPEKDVNVQPTDEDPETIKESCSNWYKNFRLTAKA